MPKRSADKEAGSSKKSKLDDTVKKICEKSATEAGEAETISIKHEGKILTLTRNLGQEPIDIYADIKLYDYQQICEVSPEERWKYIKSSFKLYLENEGEENELIEKLATQALNRLEDDESTTVTLKKIYKKKKND